MGEKSTNALKRQANELQIFESLEDYVEQFSKITGLKLENLENLFAIFFFVLLLILFAFLPKIKIVKRLRRLVW